MGEIGSEFYDVPLDNGAGIDRLSIGKMVFSGRTAIETVIKELPKAKKALLPSYCCDSIVEPFRRAGIEVSFFPVHYENGLKIELDVTQNADIVFWCNYFGFNVPMPDISGLLSNNGVIIEDVTHSLLSNNFYHQQSNFLIASLRKWEPINCGGYCVSLGSELHHVPIDRPPSEFIKKRREAMTLKAEYLIKPERAKKERYLQLFSESNQWLSKNYSSLSIDKRSIDFLASVDVTSQRRKRRNNAKALYDGLKDKVRFLFSEQDMDCPLFVPVLLSDRDKVRAYLNEEQIYCPIHWPRPNGCISNLYDIELSLICDQRYDVSDMDRIITVLSSIL